MRRGNGDIAGPVIGVVVAVSFFAAWLTHVVFCIDHERWGFLIAGAIFFPIAIVHGFGIWLGVW